MRLSIFPFGRVFLVTTVLATTAMVFPVAAQNETDAPDRIDLSSFPGQIVKQVVIPVPAEVFAVLDKVGEPDWREGIVHVEELTRTRDRGFLALSFGSLVAEGFIAVQAESPDDIQKIGRRSLDLAEALGLELAVKPHSLSIVEFAEKGKWDEVRSELDSTQQTVRDTMNRQRDQELSELVSLGGWLRGTHVLTGMILASYTRDKAELLNQPGLVRHFIEMTEGIRGSIGDTDEMAEIRKGLALIERLIEENQLLSEAQIRELHETTRRMLDQFYFEATAERP